MKASSKKRRSKAQIQEDNAREEAKQSEIEAKLAAYDQMQRELEEARAAAQNNQGATNVLSEFLRTGHAV